MNPSHLKIFLVNKHKTFKQMDVTRDRNLNLKKRIVLKIHSVGLRTSSFFQVD